MNSPGSWLLTSLCLLFLTAAFSAVGSAQDSAPDHLAEITSAADFDAMSVAPGFGSGEVERVTKFLIPASDDPELLHAVFQNVNLFDFHWKFMATVFPDKFPALSFDDYLTLVEKRQTRLYYAGTLSRLNTAQGTLYGFSVFTANSESELLSVEETRFVHDSLARVFTLQPFAYAPDTVLARDRAKGWVDPGFDVYVGPETTYEAYTIAVGYGFVSLMETLEEFESANDRGLLTFRDILVLGVAPSDIEGVVAGVATAEAQGVLSHVVIRTARRGTPNAFIKNAFERFAPFEGQLVRYEVTALEALISPATLEDAEEFWRNRPSLSKTPETDSEFAELSSFDAIARMDAEGASVVSRFGGKATGLARLQSILAAPEWSEYQEAGFAIPMRYYVEFMRSNQILFDGQLLSYEAYLQTLFESAEFKESSEFRFQTLDEFREIARDDGVVDPALIDSIEAQIGAIFGSANTMLRFRSSSNIEDDLEFNGAGLYESTSVCMADSHDGNNEGPSQCDPLQPRERTIRRALKKVWTSLWTFRAFEEREWFQVPQDLAAMGIVVNRAFLDEAANGVALTGNPSNPRDKRYVITVQSGEASVVRPEPGVQAELDVLDIEDGRVGRIDRVQSSSLVEPGESVLSDAELQILGELLWHMDQNLPLELGEHSREEVLLDVEFKLESNGDLAVKQVRPFLIPTAPPEGPVFELDIPSDTGVCGVFLDARSLGGEYESKSQLDFVEGTFLLPTDVGAFDLDIVKEIRLGPAQEILTPMDSGRVRVESKNQGNGAIDYDFLFSQNFAIPGGEVLELDLELRFAIRAGETTQTLRRLDEEFLADGLIMKGIPGGDSNRRIRFASCSYESLPLWDVRAEFSDGTHLRLQERFRFQIVGSGPANLMAARVETSADLREVGDYWNLVYAANHHNERVRYRVVLDLPVEMQGVGSVHAVDLWTPLLDTRPPTPARAAYLDQNFSVLAEPTVDFFWKGLFGTEPTRGFRRGDADSSSRVNIADALSMLGYVFRGLELSCPDAADFDDSGLVEINDPILFLNYLFRGLRLTFPPGPVNCGDDPTQDFLPSCSDSGCA